MNRTRISVGNPPSPERLYVVLLSFIDQTIDGFQPLTGSRVEDVITLRVTVFWRLLHAMY